MKDILLIISSIIGTFLVVFIRNKIVNKTKDLVREKWDTAKFLDGITNVVDPKKWGQTLAWWLNFRNWIIVGIIISVVFGWGYYKGTLGKPVNFNLNYDREFNLQLDSQKLHKPANSSQLEVLDEKGNRIKIISAKDIPELKRKLSPFGFQVKPYFSIGIALTKDKARQDIGLGVSWLKYFKYSLGNWLSNNGLWVGLDYRITDNFHLGSGIGKSWKAENLLGFRGRFDF